MIYQLCLYIVFGVLPSLVWLWYYLAKDKHPEPKKTLLKVFLWGALATIPALFYEFGLQNLATTYSPGYLTTFWGTLFQWFIVIAVIEEFMKYLVVKANIVTSGDMDEPLDLMLYMVVSALGFAALENIMYLFRPDSAFISLQALVQATLLYSFIRFIGATFLHTLSSAVLGYFMALEASAPRRKFWYTEIGFLIAVLLHGGYDLVIMKVADYTGLITLSIILLTVAVFVAVEFKKLSGMKSVSEV
jgi:RsiW-degrading membrane proteinase PrsW (M82 family)